MSICMAVIDKESATVHIATDSLSTWEGYQATDGAKFVEVRVSGIVMSYAGGTRFAQIVEHLVRTNKYFKSGLSYAAVKRLANDMHPQLKEEDIMGESQLLLVGRDHKYIYSIDTDLAVAKHKEWASIGSGGKLGECVMTALSYLDVEITTKDKLATSMEAVCEHRSDCGGKIHTKIV